MKIKLGLSVVAIALSSLAQPTYNFFIGSFKQDRPSFELSRFYVAYTYTGIEIRNNGSATASNVVVTFYFLRHLNTSFTYRSPEWAMTALIPEIKEGDIGILAMPVGRYHLESTFSGTDITDYEAYIVVFCVHEQSEIHANFHLEDFQVLPLPDV